MLARRERLRGSAWGTVDGPVGPGVGRRQEDRRKEADTMGGAEDPSGAGLAAPAVAVAVAVEAAGSGAVMVEAGWSCYESPSADDC